jgi:hypothetical protein
MYSSDTWQDILDACIVYAYVSSTCRRSIDFLKPRLIVNNIGKNSINHSLQQIKTSNVSFSFFIIFFLIFFGSFDIQILFLL